MRPQHQRQRRRWSMEAAPLPGAGAPGAGQFVGLEISIPARKLLPSSSVGGGMDGMGMRRSFSTASISMLGGGGGSSGVLGAVREEECSSQAGEQEAPSEDHKKATAALPPAAAGMRRVDSDSFLVAKLRGQRNLLGEDGGLEGATRRISLSAEDRLRMFRVLQGQHPSGKQRKRVRRRSEACRKLLKRGIGSQRSLDDMSLSDDDDGDNKHHADDDEIRRAIADMTNEEWNINGGPDAAAGTATAEKRNASSEVERPTPPPSLAPVSSSSRTTDETLSSVGRAAAVAAVSFLQSSSLASDRAETATTPRGEGRGVSGGEGCAAEEKKRREGKGADNDGEEDLASEALRHLSACALASLYEHLRDLCERGYAARNRMDDVDVNRPKRPIRPWTLDLDYDDDDDDSEEEDEDEDEEESASEVVTQDAGSRAWVQGDVGNGLGAADDEPETEHPDPFAAAGGGLPLSDESDSFSSSSASSSDSSDSLAPEQGTEAFGSGDGGGRPSSSNHGNKKAINVNLLDISQHAVAPMHRQWGTVHQYRRNNVTWGVNEVKTTADVAKKAAVEKHGSGNERDDQDEGKGEGEGRAVAAEANQEAPGGQLWQPPQPTRSTATQRQPLVQALAAASTSSGLGVGVADQKKPRCQPSILRRSSFSTNRRVPANSSPRSVCSSISGGSEDEGDEFSQDEDIGRREGASPSRADARSPLSSKAAGFAVARRSNAHHSNDGLQVPPLSLSGHGAGHGGPSSSFSADTSDDEGDDEEKDEGSDCAISESDNRDSKKLKNDKKRSSGKLKRKAAGPAYLANTRTAGSVIRRLMEEMEAAAATSQSSKSLSSPKAASASARMSRHRDGSSVEGDDVGSYVEDLEDDFDRGIMSEFRRWIEESRRSSGRGRPPSKSSRGRPTKSKKKSKSSSSSVPYFEAGSVLGLMMERGIEIAYFGSCPVNEVTYCLCVNRSTTTVKVVFLGSSSASAVESGADTALLHRCSARPRFAEYRNPIRDDTPGQEGGEGAPDVPKVVRLHEGFCSPLLRKRRDEGWGTTKFDEIRRRVDDLGRELCDDHRASRAAAGESSSSSYRIVVAGHGLGGALATTFSFFYAAYSASCAHRNDNDDGSDDTSADTATAAAVMPIQAFTYGSPRIGDAAFRSAFQYLERTGRLRHARCVSRGDIIPLLPLFAAENGQRGNNNRASALAGLLFKHVGLKVTLTERKTEGGSLPKEGIMRTSYPLESSGWIGELRRACSDSILPPLLLAFNEFGTNHSLSEHHGRLQLAAQQQRGGGSPASLEGQYRAMMSLSTRTAEERKFAGGGGCRRRCMHASVLLAVLGLLYGMIVSYRSGIFDDSSARYQPFATEREEQRDRSLLSCPLGSRGVRDAAASRSNSSNDDGLAAPTIAPNARRLELGGNEVDVTEGATASFDAPSQPRGIVVDEPEDVDIAAENEISAHGKVPFPECTEEASEAPLGRPMNELDDVAEETNADTVEPAASGEQTTSINPSAKSNPFFFATNPSEVAFVDRRDKQLYRLWGLATTEPPATCHPIGSEIIETAKRRSELKSLQIETEARANFARSNITIPTVVGPCLEGVGCK